MRRFLGRFRFWILGIALAFKVVDLATSGALVALLGGFGRFVSVMSGLVLVVGAFLGFRWIMRKFLFRVSRRLGLAFLFVGVFPLFFFALFVLGIGAVGLVRLADHDVNRRLETIAGELTGDAEWVAGAMSGSDGSALASGWHRPDRPGTGDPGAELLVWIGTPGTIGSGGDQALDAGRGLSLTGGTTPSGLREAGAPPGWLRDGFSGVVAVGDSLVLLGARAGETADGRPFVAMATRLVDRATVERISTETGFTVTLASSEDATAPASGDDHAPESPAPGTAEAPPDEGDGDEGSPGLNVTVSTGEKASGSTVVLVPAVRWPDGAPAIWVDSDGDEHPGVPGLEAAIDLDTYVRSKWGGATDVGLLGKITLALGITMLSMMIIATLIGVGLTSSLTRAVNALHKGTRRIAAGDLDHRIRVKSRDQLGALATSFNEMTESVSHLLEEKAEKERLEHEMEIAAGVQQTMLPKRFPTIPGLEGAARSIMARHVGGDLYDFIPIGNDQVALVIGDVSGKGVSAALVMSNVISSLRSMLASGGSPGPGELLRRLNRILYASTAPDCFVTLFYAEYSMRTGKLRYANAGHDWPMVVGPSGQLVVDLEAGGIMLGAFPEVKVVEQEIVLEPGQVIVAYSDGLIDTVNEKDEPFGRERARDVIAEQRARPPAEILDLVERELRDFQGGAEEVDDVTIIVLKRVPLPGSHEELEDAVRSAMQEVSEAVGGTS